MELRPGVEFVKQEVDFNLWTFENFFITNLAQRILDDSEEFDFYKIEAERTSRPHRIWMHEYDKHSYREAIEFLNSNWLKEKFSELTGVDYTGLASRIELCKDSAGSWLEEHTDDVAKVLTCQIFLTTTDSSTALGSYKSQARQNCGWIFANTGTEAHSLPPLQEHRVSIILNYVNDKWRDRGVLIE